MRVRGTKFLLCVVVNTLQAGSREDVNRGSDANPLLASDIEAKFWANATRAVNRVRAERVYEAVMGLDKAADGWGLMDALAAN